MLLLTVAVTLVDGRDISSGSVRLSDKRKKGRETKPWTKAEMAGEKQWDNANSWRILNLKQHLGWLGIGKIRTIASAKAIVPTIQKRNQCVGIEDSIYLVEFGMVRLFGFGMLFGIQTIENPNGFWPFKIWFCWVLQPPLYVKEVKGVKWPDLHLQMASSFISYPQIA